MIVKADVFMAGNSPFGNIYTLWISRGNLKDNGYMGLI